MTINHNNIDQWLFNYYEGNLNSSETKALESFLAKHPEYYEDAQAWKSSFVEEAVPAFNTASLLKTHAPANERKRYALALAALLLIGSSSAFYFITSTKQTEQYNSSSSATVNSFINPTAKTPETQNGHSSSVRPIPNSNQISGTHVAPTKPIIHQNTAHTSLNTGLTHKTNTYTTNTPHYTVKGNSPKNNFTATETQAYNTSKTTEKQNDNLTPITQSHTQNTGIEHTNSNLLENMALNSPEKNQDLTNTHLPNVDDTNATLITAQTGSEMLNMAIVGEEAINLSTSETENGQRLYDMNGLSDINPDALLKNNSLANMPKTEVDNEKNKLNLSAPKGVRFGNLRNVVLLNGNNYDFQTNASFIAQHFSTDGYMGGNYLSTTSRGQQQTGAVAGVSHYFRNAKFSVNAFGTYTNNAFFKSQSANLQSALHIKLDRHHFILPSFGVSFTQYTFTSPSLLSNAENPNHFFTQLSNLQEVAEVKNTNQFNLNAGVLYHHKKFYMALSANGLMQPKFKYVNNDKMSFAQLPARVNFVAGTDFISKNRPELSLSPQMILEVYDMEASASVGALVKYKTIKAGAAVSSRGTINTYFGFSQKLMHLQYRFVLDKTDAPYNFVTGHYISTSFNLKGLGKKKKAILDEEK